MSEMSPQRKKVVVLAALIACMGTGPILLKGHPELLLVWLAAMVIVLIFTGMEFVKLKGKG